MANYELLQESVSDFLFDEADGYFVQEGATVDISKIFANAKKDWKVSCKNIREYWKAKDYDKAIDECDKLTKNLDSLESDINEIKDDVWSVIGGYFYQGFCSNVKALLLAIPTFGIGAIVSGIADTIHIVVGVSKQWKEDGTLTLEMINARRDFIKGYFETMRKQVSDYKRQIKDAAKAAKEKADLTSSDNRDLYKEFVEKRHDKVAEFMKNVAEPTNQEIHIPEIPEKEPVKNKFSEQSNEEIAKKLMQDMHEPEDDDPDDYENESQKEAVEKNLSAQFTGLVIRAIIIFILFFGSLALCLSPMLGYALPDAFSFEKSGIVFPIINLAIVCIAALTCHVAVGGGLLSLVRFRAGNDTFATCSVIGAAALGVSFIADPSAMSPGGENLFFPITILGLFFNTVGKLLSAARIKNNFEVLTTGKGKSSLLPVRNRELARELTGQRDETPRFCTSAKAKFFTRFLELSYRDDATESIARIVAPIVFLCSILVGVIAFLLTGRVSDAITGFAAILCVAAPFSATIAGSLPVFRSCCALNEEGSMLTGGYTAETFAETDSVLLDIEQLFPEGSIVLHGIKTFSQGRIDEAILDAASVICSTRSTLGSIFLNVVQGDKKLLKPVDTIIYEDGMGLSAWVGGKRVLIGNRELMINHGIDIPSHDYENKYVGSGKDILYLANSGELTAMFVLSYHADREVYRSLGIMAERGVRLVINCSDPNITAKKLGQIFGYPESQLNLLSSKYQQKCAELTEERESAPAAAVYDGSLFALSDMLNCCGIIRQSSFAAALLEMIGIILGFILVTIFLFTGNIRDLAMYVLLGFQMFWLAAITVVILLRKKI